MSFQKLNNTHRRLLALALFYCCLPFQSLACTLSVMRRKRSILAQSLSLCAWWRAFKSIHPQCCHFEVYRVAQCKGDCPHTNENWLCWGGRIDRAALSVWWFFLFCFVKYSRTTQIISECWCWGLLPWINGRNSWYLKVLLRVSHFLLSKIRFVAPFRQFWAFFITFIWIFPSALILTAICFLIFVLIIIFTLWVFDFLHLAQYSISSVGDSHVTNFQFFVFWVLLFNASSLLSFVVRYSLKCPFLSNLN
jgi:hypothetical protein